VGWVCSWGGYCMMRNCDDVVRVVMGGGVVGGGGCRGGGG